MDSTRTVILWKFEYHMGESSRSDFSVPLFLYFLYAENAEEARKKLEEVKPKLKEDLLKSGWKGELYEERLEPAPHGFNTGKRYFSGKIGIDERGNPIKPIRYR